jgi:DME family drug/metabolite transporter
MTHTSSAENTPPSPFPHPHLRDYLPIALATLFWAMPTLFIRYIRRETDGHFQVDAMNLYRYAAGSSFGLILVAFWRPHDFAPVLKKLWVPALLAFFLTLFQIIWVRGVCLVSAPYSTLIGRSSLIFNLLFVFILFREERHLIRSRRFLIVSTVCLATVAGIAIADPSFTLHGTAANANYLHGTLLLLLAALLWSFYTMAVRRFAKHLPSAATFALTSSLCTLFFIPLTWGNGSLEFIKSPECSGRVLWAVIASGALCIAGAQMLFYASLKRIGVVRSSLFSLLTPFLTGLLSLVTLGEVLKPVQWLLGIVLIAGLAVIIITSTAKPPLPKVITPDQFPDPIGQP